MIMADKKPAKAQDEPSIEEILGSIRRIIAEDDGTTAPKTAEPAEAMDDEPLELTNKIEPDGTIVNADAKAEPVAASVAETVETVDLAFVDGPTTPQPAVATEPDIMDEPVAVAPVQPAKPAPEFAPEPAVVTMESQMPQNDFPQDDVLSDNAANAAAAAMAKLARQAAVNDEGHDGITIEGIVREMLKPMLREWLDKNLPDMVQKSVERELEKLSKRV